MTITAPTAATQPAAKAQIVKASIRTVAAVVALAAGTLLFAAPAADARPPKETEDAIKSVKADCAKRPSGKWVPNGVMGFVCDYRSASYYFNQYIDRQGTPFQICYRLDIEAPWICK